LLSGDDSNLSILDCSDPDFWSLQVLQDTDRARDLQFQFAYRIVNFGVITMRAMTEVQPKRVNAREEERFQHFGRSTRRTDCSNDFGSAIAAHCSFGLSAASGNQNGSDIVDIGAGRDAAGLASNVLRYSDCGLFLAAFSIVSSANLIAEARSRNISRTLLAGFSDSVDANEIPALQSVRSAAPFTMAGVHVGFWSTCVVRTKGETPLSK